MRILVAYASRHGATKGIAERIAATLSAEGLDATLVRADEATGVEGFDAFVVGGSAYMFHWAKASVDFVHRHRTLLASRPTWLFSSGPLGTDRVDAKGQDVLVTCVPREFPELGAAVRPRGQKIFFGAWDPAARPIGLVERLTRLMPAARDAMPAGDFRDWPEIEGWAGAIAAELLPAPAAVGA